MVTQRSLSVIGLTAVIACFSLPVHGKDKVKVGFIGPLTGGTAANGLGGRN
jgi:branched-chain amino acid transport system substrate-binding protein